MRFKEANEPILRKEVRLMATKTIPLNLTRDMYWKPVLLLFKEHSKLQSCFTTKYFDFDNELIHINKLKRAARPWSQSEKFMLNLALHLFNDFNKLPNGLSDMSCLEDYNKSLVIKAINLRYL